MVFRSCWKLAGGFILGKNLTVYVPESLAKEMEKFPEVSWSKICREAITDYIAMRSKRLNLIRQAAKEAAYEVLDEHLSDYEHKEKPVEAAEILFEAEG
jgi:hypothetical protein